jgi:hypothetical protein
VTAIADILAEQDAMTFENRGDPFLKRLSASSLGMFSRCPDQFRRRYLLRELEPASARLLWGSADDAAATHNYQQKITTHEDIPVDEVQDAFRDAVRDEIEAAGGISEVLWEDTSPIEIVDQGARLVYAYHEQVAPTVQPTAVQEWFETEIAGIELPIVGKIDVLREVSVIDGKTGRAKKSKPEPHWRLQGGIYMRVAQRPMEWHLRTKTKTPAVYTPENEPGLRIELTAGEIDLTERKVRSYWDLIVHYMSTYGPYEPWPTSAPDYGWACSNCWYKPGCSWWA